jgi:hypothetical protein
MTTATSFKRHPTSCLRPTSTASEPCRSRGHDEAPRRPDSEKLRANAKTMPLRGEDGRSGKRFLGSTRRDQPAPRGPRVVQQSGHACGSAIGRPILYPLTYSTTLTTYWPFFCFADFGRL